MKEGRFDISEASAAAERSSKRRWNLAKNMLIAALAIVVVVLAVKLALANKKQSTDESEAPADADHRPLGVSDGVGGGGREPADVQLSRVCMNEQCVSAAHTLFKNMDLSADPCQDFNRFACGRFQKEFNIPEDKSRWNSFTPIREIIFDRAKVILEEPETQDEWKSEKMAKMHYQSCMDEEKIESVGLKPLSDELSSLGGWPVVEGSSWAGDETFDWSTTTVALASHGFYGSSLVSEYINTDDRNSSWRAIFLDQPALGLNREYLIKGKDDKDVQAYRTFFKKVAKLLGAEEEAAEKESAEVVDFAIALALITAPREERRNASRLYNPRFLSEFPSLPGHPSNWHEYVSGMLPGAPDIAPDERVIVVNPAYFANLSALIVDTPKRTLANYVLWRAVQSSLTYLNEAAREAAQDFKAVLKGVKRSPPRWKECAEFVGFNSYSSSSLRIPAASMYVKRHFSPEAKKEMLDMIGYIRNAFTKIIDDLDWMDQKTKAKARQKMLKMDEFIGYPDELLDEEKVDGHHRGVDIDAGDFFGNERRLTLWHRKYSQGKLREKVDKKFWVDHSLAALVNAFYNPSINSMEFPAGILQGLFFDHRVPKYLNYGAIGAVIGHELTHGFDDQGRQYDAEGNLKDWWEPETKQLFVSKTGCVISQYGNYSSEQVGMNLNGITTQGENIADNGGIKEAYMAYENWVSQNADEPLLPGHPFTPRQLFWISWGQVWCTKYRDEAMKNQIKTGAHSPGPWRIIGPLSNSPEFAAAFKCPSGSPMNPESKCAVW